MDEKSKQKKFCHIIHSNTAYKKVPFDLFYNAAESATSCFATANKKKQAG